MYDHLNDTALRSVAALVHSTSFWITCLRTTRKTARPPRQHPDLGKRTMPLSRELWIEREDFQEMPAKGFFRLSPGARVRLRYAYVIECTGVDKDAAGRVMTVHATLLVDSKSGTLVADTFKVKGNLD